MVWAPIVSLLRRLIKGVLPMSKKPLNIRMHEQVMGIFHSACMGKWTNDVEKFDKEQAKKDMVSQTNKAIKDRRGIKD